MATAEPPGAGVDDRGEGQQGMATQHQEVERKFDVAPDVALTGLEGLPGVVSVAAPAVHELDATYFDTADLALLGAGITLRRRTGGEDAGWHLKLPVTKGERTEIGLPLDPHDAAGDPPGDAAGGVEGGSRAVPEELLTRVRAFVRDRPVTPVATLRSRRTVHRVLDERGESLAEISDDVVTAQSLGDGGANGSATLSTWREWEVELEEGDHDLLAAAGELLASLGATVSERSAKLERALDGRTPAVQMPVFADLTEASPAGEVLQAHLVDHIDTLRRYDDRVRVDQPDAVHKMRVATRRLRSALSTFRPLLDRSVTDPIRDELRWLAGVLGVARDAEVQRARFAEVIRSEPDELVMGPVARWIDRDWAQRHRTAHDALVRVLDEPRYFALLESLERLAIAPPFTDLAAEPADTVLTKRVRRAYRRLRDEVRAVRAAATPQERDHLLHEARKDAKRLRYAAEAVEPAFGAPAKDLAGAAEDLQEVLGEHQDSVVARENLREMAVRAHLDGENVFSFGRLHALEQARADQAERQFEGAWEALSAKRLRGWLAPS